MTSQRGKRINARGRGQGEQKGLNGGKVDSRKGQGGKVESMKGGKVQ